MAKTKKKAKANGDEPEMSFEQTKELFERASKQLEQVEQTIIQLKAILDRGVQMAKLAKDKGDRELQADAVEVQLRAKRRIGQMVFGSVD